MMRLSDFEARYRELVSSVERHGVNQSCVECEHCQACNLSTFCRHSRQLVRCHYCVECEQCSDSSHCRGSSGLLSCHHCVDTTSCVRSSYLVRCSSLSHCNYCLGCVGLSHRDYHILNQPYDRSEYFSLTRDLLRQLGA
jgi:hypothetical protein